MNARFNFARRPFRNDRPAFAAVVALMLIGAALLAVNIRLFADYRRQVADTRAEIAALEARGALADEKTQAARSALGSYRLSSLAEESRGLARVVAERRFSWTSLLSRLERTLPFDVGVVHLQPQFGVAGDVTLTLQFVARNREAIVHTIEALSKNPAFGQVELRSESQPEAAAEPLQFVLACHYEPGEAR